jgi:hypothetical protein
MRRYQERASAGNLHAALEEMKTGLKNYRPIPRPYYFIALIVANTPTGHKAIFTIYTTTC